MNILGLLVSADYPVADTLSANIPSDLLIVILCL